MSQHWIWINSASYRRFVDSTRDRKWLLALTGCAFAGVSMVAGYVIANATNPNFEDEGYKDKQAELAKLPYNQQVRLQQLNVRAAVSISNAVESSNRALRQ